MKKEKIKKWNDNSGFSLVELIIVIAIMAILVGVLAPQYMRYVERSRQSADIQNLESAVSALKVYAADPEAATQFTTGGGTLTVISTGAAVSAGTDAAVITAGLQAAGIELTALELRSAQWNPGAVGGAAGAVVLTVDIDANGIFVVTANTDRLSIPETP